MADRCGICGTVFRDKGSCPKCEPRKPMQIRTYGFSDENQAKIIYKKTLKELKAKGFTDKDLNIKKKKSLEDTWGI